MTKVALPLAGVRVVVTRAAHQSEGLQAAIRDRGGDAPLLPLLAVNPPRDPGPLHRGLETIDRFDALVLTSKNAVDAVLEALPRLRPGTLVAAVGQTTAETLEAAGVPEVVRPGPGDSRAEGLVELLEGRLPPGATVLLPLAADARPVLERGLEAAGYRPLRVTAYEKRLPEEAPELYRELFADAPWGWVTFTSPRVARHFRELAGSDWESRRHELRAASIGPVTSKALHALGVEPAAEAAAPGELELVEAIVRAVAGERRHKGDQP